MKKHRLLSLILLLVILALAGCKSPLKASEYVQANLDLIFQGETSGAKQFIDASQSELEQMYDNGINAFVEGYLTNGLDEDGEYTDYFAYLVKEIFMTMRYSVGEAQKIDADTYEVEVTYNPVNVFTLFIEKLNELSEELERRADSGYYEGTQEVQKQLMLIDYLESSYLLLGDAYFQMQYGENETFVFTVSRGEKNVPALKTEEINSFIECILALDKL